MAKGCKEEDDIQIGRTASWHDIFKTSSLTELKHKNRGKEWVQGEEEESDHEGPFMTKGIGFWRWISKEFYKGCIFWVMKANILNKINSGP